MRSYLFIIVAALIPASFLFGCSDSVSTSDIPDVPEFPTLAPASVISEHQQLMDLQSGTESPGTHFEEAFEQANRVFVAFIRAVGTPGTIFQQLSNETDPAFNEHTFEWRIEEQVTGDLLTYRSATARIVGEQEFEWTLKTGFDAGIPLPGFGDIILFRGIDRKSPNGNTVQVADPTAGFGFIPDLDPDNRFGNLATLFDLSWDVQGESERTVTLRGNGAKDGFLFRLVQQQRQLTLSIDRPDETTVQFFIDLETAAGYLLQDGERTCWDQSLQNSECPA